MRLRAQQLAPIAIADSGGAVVFWAGERPRRSIHALPDRIAE
jgi:L-lactate utilization protein LutC